MTESLTNMEAVKPKGPKVFVAGLVLVALGGVAWFFLGREPGPVGAPEDPTHLLIIGTDDPAVPILEQMGFSIEQRELAAAAADGRSAGSSAQDDIEAALYYADSQGCGYVAFANAGAMDFGARAVSSDSATITKEHRYAVFSVGDFATPVTKVSVDPTPKRYELPPHVELVRALFEHEKLAATLVGENNLSMDAQPLYERIEAAVDLKGAFGLIEQKAAAAEKRLAEYVVDSEEATPKPAVLSKGIERSHGFALANGGVLLLIDAPILQEPATDRASLEWTGDTRAWIQDLQSGDRTRCEAADRVRPAEVTVDADGRTLLAQWGARELMVFTVNPDKPGCSLTAAGTIEQGEGHWGRANAAGQVVRAVSTEGVLVAEIHSPGTPHPQTWPLAGCTAVSSPVWLDDTHIATSCEYEPAFVEPTFDPESAPEDSPQDAPDAEPAAPVIPEQRWLYILSIEDGSVLALPTGEGPTFNPDVWLRPTAAGLSVLTDAAKGITTYAFPSDVAGLFAAPPLDPLLPRPAFVEDSASGVQALRPDAATSKLHTVEDPPDRFVLSPQGDRIVFSVDRTGEFDRNLAVYDFATGKVRRIAINEWARHDSPSFSPDGKTVVFNSSYSTAGYGRATVAQAVTLPES